MMNIETGMLFPFSIEEEGTVMDYVEDEFIFVIKDSIWTEEERKGFLRNELRIDFVYKYDIALFLVTVEDAIDTSDFIFNVHDNDYPASLFREFENNDGYFMSIYLLDETNKVCAKRRVHLSKTMSSCIAENLKKQKKINYIEEEFACNLSGLQDAWEPFELQEMALCSQVFK